jgi:hypothetical protein
VRIAITGKKGLGGVEMRGESLANACGWDFIPVHKIKASDSFDLLILVKYWDTHAAALRAAAKRLIHDPLDCWEGLKQGHQHPQEFWRWVRRRFPFDELISTSPMCRVQMQAALPACKVHLLPHHADPRIEPDWYDPDGPAVYAGAVRFMESVNCELVERLQAETQRGLFCDFSRDAWKSLKGASHAVLGRWGQTQHPLNDACKPQVKLENALQAGLPIFGRLDRAGLSLLTPRAGNRCVTVIPTDGPLGTLELHPAGAKPVTLADSAAGYKAIFERGEAYDWIG